PRRRARRPAAGRDPPRPRDASRRGAAMRAVVADDSPLMRAGVARVLADAGFDIVAEAADEDELRRAVEETRPDLAVVDVRMPPTNTDEGARTAVELRQLYPGLRIVLLSQIVEPRHALRLLREDAAGFGYLLKDRVLDVDDFVDSVRRVANGGMAIDP